MPQIKFWHAAVLIGLASMLLLGRLSTQEDGVQDQRRDLAAAVPLPLMNITDDNLPDAVASLPLKLRVTRVGWDHRTLAIDLAMSDHERQPAAIWQDLAAIIRFSFGETGNVRQTLVRIYQDTENGGKILMFYGDPRREDWTSDRMADLQAPDSGAGEAFRSKIGLSATPTGTRWLSDV